MPESQDGAETCPEYGSRDGRGIAQFYSRCPSGRRVRAQPDHQSNGAARHTEGYRPEDCPAHGPRQVAKNLSQGVHESRMPDALVSGRYVVGAMSEQVISLRSTGRQGSSAGFRVLGPGRRAPALVGCKRRRAGAGSRVIRKGVDPNSSEYTTPRPGAGTGSRGPPAPSGRPHPHPRRDGNGPRPGKGAGPEQFPSAGSGYFAAPNGSAAAPTGVYFCTATNPPRLRSLAAFMMPLAILGRWVK